MKEKQINTLLMAATSLLFFIFGSAMFPFFISEKNVETSIVVLIAMIVSGASFLKLLRIALESFRAIENTRTKKIGAG